MRVGSLFSGVGGFDLGLERAGMTVAWQCEIDRHARTVLRRHWPETTIFEDVRRIGWRDLERHGPVDILCGGFPCQDLSVAGKRAGLSGKRSGLFFRLCRVITRCRPKPRWILLENVTGLLSSKDGRDMDAVLKSLVGLGYSVAWRIFDAQHDGVPQRRRRVFLVGYLGEWKPAAEVLFERQSLRGHPPAREKAGKDITQALTRSLGAGGADDNRAQGGFYVPAIRASQGGGDKPHVLAYALGSHAGAADGHQTNKSHDNGGPVGSGISEECAYSLRAGRTQSIASPLSVRRLTPTECCRLMSWPDDWNAWGMDDAGNLVEMSDSARYRQCGNGVVANVAEWIGRRIMTAEQRRAAELRCWRRRGGRDGLPRIP